MDRQSVTREREASPTLASLFDSWQQLFPLELPPDELARRILKVVAQTTQSSRASLLLLDDEDCTLHIEAAVGLPDEVVATTRIRLGEGIAGWVALHRQALLLPGGPEVPAPIRQALVSERHPPPPAPPPPSPTERFDQEGRGEGGGGGPRSALCVPLEVKGRVLGVLNLARQEAGPPFTQHDLWFASLIADRVAIALHSARLHNQLETREQFTTRILESIPTSLVVIDRARRIVSVNRNFLERVPSGCRRESQTTLGRKLGEVFPPALTECTQLDQKVREVFRTGQSVEGGKVSYRAPGLPTRIYYYRLIPLKSEKGIENVMLSMDDITEREHLEEEVRQAERHLASVVECANDLVVSMDPQGHIVTWNRAAERASGLKIEQVKGRSLVSLCAAEQQPVMTEMLDTLRHGEGAVPPPPPSLIEESIRRGGGRAGEGGPPLPVEVNLVTADGWAVPIAWNCSPMRNDDGTVRGIVAVGRDLTERRQLEAQLIQSAKMASLGVMAGGIAHELRNPLGIISASAQLLLEHQDDSLGSARDKAYIRHECARKIHAATQRASLIIENLLKFARAQGGRKREVDLHTVLDETLVLLAHQMTLQQITLRKEWQPDLPRVHGNPEMLQQVFTNIILNACNAMRQGGTLTIATRVAEPGSRGAGERRRGGEGERGRRGAVVQ
jgi:PAS domain S-box-containing protein